MKWTIAILLSSVGATVSADEYYEFFAVRCAPPVAFASIESLGLANIGKYVWPAPAYEYNEVARKSWLADGWRLHEENLKILEEKYGLYVFGQAYGRYDPEPIVCENTRYRLEISTEPVERHFTKDDDIVVRYRGPMKVRVELRGGGVAFEQTLAQGDSIRVYQDELEICDGQHDEPGGRDITCSRKSLRPL